MRRFYAVLGILVFSGAMTFAETAKPTLAVLDVAGTKVEQAKLNLVYGYIIDKVNRTGKYSIVERSALDKVLKELEISSSDVVDEKTVMEIGKISGAEFLLVSTLAMENDSYYLSMRVISVKTGKVTRTSAKNTKLFEQIENLTKETVDYLFDADNKLIGYFATGLGFGISFPIGDTTSVWSRGLTPLLTLSYNLVFDWGVVGLGICSGASFLSKNPAISYNFDTYAIPVAAGIRYQTNPVNPLFGFAEAYGGGSVLIVVYGPGFGYTQPIAMKPLIMGTLGAGYAISKNFSASMYGTFTTILMDSAAYFDITPGLRVEYDF
jgi:hypothetical protein